MKKSVILFCLALLSANLFASPFYPLGGDDWDKETTSALLSPSTTTSYAKVPAG